MQRSAQDIVLNAECMSGSVIFVDGTTLAEGMKLGAGIEVLSLRSPAPTYNRRI